jgi:hypothetical protein
LGTLLSDFAYFTPPSAFNPYQAVGSAIFWLGAFLLMWSLFLGRTLTLAANFAKTRTGALIGGAYITAHLLLYGFVLEGILVFIYGITPFVSSPVAYLSSDVLYPASLGNALVGLGFSPTINLLVPPYFEASLSFFSIFIAVVVDALILANINKVKEIGDVGPQFARSRAYLLMPFTGIILGASCCMSLPLLLSIVAPSLQGAANLIWAFYLTYFLLPPLAVIVLKLNLDLASSIAAKVSAQKV